MFHCLPVCITFICKFLMKQTIKWLKNSFLQIHFWCKTSNAALYCLMFPFKKCCIAFCLPVETFASVWFLSSEWFALMLVVLCGMMWYQVAWATQEGMPLQTLLFLEVRYPIWIRISVFTDSQNLSASFP